MRYSDKDWVKVNRYEKKYKSLLNNRWLQYYKCVGQFERTG